jgi:predicted ABC-type transport system involved in lysophospholipase L1 biosynthesis ATPase subunit
LIHASDVSKTYGHAGHQIAALDRVSLSVESGQKIAIVGKSGSGKSTLLNLLAGLDHPTTGTLAVNDQRLDQMRRHEMAKYRCSCVGVIFQAFQLLPHHTAVKNIELPLVLSRMPRDQRTTVAHQWLDRVGLTDRARHLPYALSGGEQQRVAIARALVHRPRLLLADEPTGNLDSTTADQIEQLILELCDETKATFVLVTHDERLAARCSDRQFRMADGSLSERDANAVD